MNESGNDTYKPPKFIITDFIHGTTTSGEPVTLFNCIQNSADGKTGLAGSFFQTEFIIHFAFLGVHFSDRASMEFESLSIDFYNLNSWYNNNCIKTEIPKSGTEVITFVRPIPIDIEVSGFLIRFGAFEGIKIQQNFASLSTNPKIIVKGSEKKQFEDYMQLVRLIQNFLTFVITSPSYVIEMSGYLPQNKNAKQFSMPINVFFIPNGWQPETNEIFWANMMLSFNEIADNLPTILREWINKSEILKPVYDLYFANYYKNSYPENEFLNLTQAIETYHRRKYGGKYISDEEYKSNLYQLFVAVIPDGIPEDFRHSLKNGKLRYANEFSLRKRLLLLFNMVSEKYNIDFLSNGRNQGITKLIADTRNYLTHYPPELKDIAVTNGAALSEINRKLDIIIRVLLLEEIGLDVEHINKILRKSKRYFSNF